jgi:hypothetical protein
MSIKKRIKEVAQTVAGAKEAAGNFYTAFSQNRKRAKSLDKLVDRKANEEYTKEGWGTRVTSGEFKVPKFFRGENMTLKEKRDKYQNKYKHLY